MAHRTKGSRRPRRGILLPLLSVTLLLVIAGIVFARNPEYAQDSIPTITGNNRWWLVLGFAGVCVSFLCSAAVLIGLATVHIKTHVAVIGQWAAAGSKVIAPAASGVVGLNARLVMKHGVSLTGAVTTVAATQVAQLGLTAVLVAIFLPMVGATPKFKIPEGPGYWVAGALVIAALGGYLLYKKRTSKRPAPGTLTFKQQLGTSLRSVGVAMTSPARLFLVVGGSLGLTFSLAVCMWAMVHAVGGSSTFLSAAVVMMVGAGLGSFFPTPGGVGGVEASMVALFLAAGQPYDVAFGSVILFRIMSFWLPAPVGALAAVWLHRHHYL